MRVKFEGVIRNAGADKFGQRGSVAIVTVVAFGFLVAVMAGGVYQAGVAHQMEASKLEAKTGALIRAQAVIPVMLEVFKEVAVANTVNDVSSFGDADILAKLQARISLPPDEAAETELSFTVSTSVTGSQKIPWQSSLWNIDTQAYDNYTPLSSALLDRARGTEIDIVIVMTEKTKETHKLAGGGQRGMEFIAGRYYGTNYKFVFTMSVVPIPNFTFANLHGESLSLTRVSGRGLVQGSWCPAGSITLDMPLVAGGGLVFPTGVPHDLYIEEVWEGSLSEENWYSNQVFFEAGLTTEQAWRTAKKAGAFGVDRDCSSLSNAPMVVVAPPFTLKNWVKTAECDILVTLIEPYTIPATNTNIYCEVTSDAITIEQTELFNDAVQPTGGTTGIPDNDVSMARHYTQLDLSALDFYQLTGFPNERGGGVLKIVSDPSRVSVLEELTVILPNNGSGHLWTILSDTPVLLHNPSQVNCVAPAIVCVPQTVGIRGELFLRGAYVTNDSLDSIIRGYAIDGTPVTSAYLFGAACSWGSGSGYAHHQIPSAVHLEKDVDFILGAENNERAAFPAGFPQVAIFALDSFTEVPFTAEAHTTH